MLKFKNPERQQKEEEYHSKGPKDVTWKGSKRAVGAFHITRSTMDSEQISFGVPVFDNDTEEELMSRFNVMSAVVQKRMDDLTAAMEAGRENDEEEREKERARVEALRKR